MSIVGLFKSVFANDRQQERRGERREQRAIDEKNASASQSPENASFGGDKAMQPQRGGQDAGQAEHDETRERFRSMFGAAPAQTQQPAQPQAPIGQDARTAALEELAGSPGDMQNATANAFAPQAAQQSPYSDPAFNDEVRRRTQSMFSPAPMRRY